MISSLNEDLNFVFNSARPRHICPTTDFKSGHVSSHLVQFLGTHRVPTISFHIQRAPRPRLAPRTGIWLARLSQVLFKGPADVITV